MFKNNNNVHPCYGGDYACLNMQSNSTELDSVPHAKKVQQKRIIQIGLVAIVNFLVWAMTIVR